MSAKRLRKSSVMLARPALLAFIACLAVSLVSASREINNLLVNDLNIIANKLDDIPETSLNIKFILMALECNDVRLTWKLNTNNLRTSNELNFFSKNKKSGSASVTVVQPPKIFGYQIVVRELLEPTAAAMSREMNQFSDKTMRVYSSKFIYPTQSKFKLINLLRKNTASYHICLVIYIDVTETVAFEKQCINFSLPNVPSHIETACKAKSSGKKTQTTVLAVTKPRASRPVPATHLVVEAADSMGSLTTTPLDYFSAFEEKLSQTFVETEQLKPVSNQTAKSNRPGHNDVGKFNQPRKQTKHGLNVQVKTWPDAARNSSQSRPGHPSAAPASDGNPYQCENSAQCRNYSNLLIAFVVCGILLGTNVFMFTLIIIQNTIKLGLLRQKVKATKSYYKKKGNYISYHAQYLDAAGDKTFLNSEQELAADEYKGCCAALELKKAFAESCSDVFQAICCGAVFRGAKRPPRRHHDDKGDYGSTAELRLDSELNPSCTTITRPGYILQVPSSVMSHGGVASSLNTASPKKTGFFASSTKNNSPSHSPSSHLFAKSSLITNKFKSDFKKNQPFVPAHYMSSGLAHSNSNVSQNYSNNYSYSQPRHLEQQHHSSKTQLIGYTNYQLQQQQSDDSSTSVSCLDRNEMGNYDNEVFYHMPKGVNSQISSAF